MLRHERGEFAVTVEGAGERLGDEVDPLPDGALDIVELGAEHVEGALDEILGGGIEYRLLRREVVEEGRLADPQLSDDVLNTCPVEPERTKQHQRRLDDRGAHRRLLLFTQTHAIPPR